MADWWDAIFNPQGMREYFAGDPKFREPQPRDEVIRPDTRARWEGSRGWGGERLDPNTLGIYGTPQPAGTPRFQPEGRDVVLPSRPSQPFLDRSRYVNQLPESRLTLELMNRHKAGQLGDREAYEILNSPEFSDENTLGAFREMESIGRGNSYLTRINDGGGAAPPYNVLSHMPRVQPQSRNYLVPYGLPDEEDRGAPRSDQLPSDLPEAVRRSIIDQPSYSEGQMIPRPMPSLEEELAARFGPQREEPLMEALGRGRMFREENYPLPDMIPDDWIGSGGYPDPDPLEELRRRRLESESYQPISDVRPSQDQYRRPPLASGVAPLPSARGFDPLIDLQGDMSMNRRFQRSPLNLQGVYRRTFPF